ncbi:hypothetical protein KC340_g2822 [Hortaea werneckii]|nr:hypothetical protein KC342_g2750 [Hortaea werneckii]KAI7107742.1 hypothetical protein KC339_g2094 [Hortaea werneckii]KAI7234521.1 hypothetical protein KC365_g5932 [Hortaea werneckii]KAI7333574.1 hypothetical protein KC340_g2822 [Hortaea werneckii]KAI7402499.1 hypothetical protein KC328_g2761 [Hortaea werneckii]
MATTAGKASREHPHHHSIPPQHRPRRSSGHQGGLGPRRTSQSAETAGEAKAETETEAATPATASLPPPASKRPIGIVPRHSPADSADFASSPGPSSAHRDSLTRSPSSAARSPDTASPIYPDRAIRPLPRSRLKSRLSPEQASHIVYPPAPPLLSPTLQFSHPTVDDQRHVALGRGVPVGGHYEDSNGGCVHHCTCGDDVDSGDEEVEFDHPDYRYHTASGSVPPANGKPVDNIQQRLMAASKSGGKLPPSLSSADGYESFENTSNKKKRKIPLSSANSSLQQHQLSAEMASMGLNGSTDGTLEDDGPQAGASHPSPHGTQTQANAPVASGSGTGISGAGRGRYGRHMGWARAGERRPLGSSFSGGNGGYGAIRTPGKNGGGDLPNGVENEKGGIISQAIKSAAEQGPLTPPSAAKSAGSGGRESRASNTTPKTQFTFHCESESANKMEQQAADQRAAYAHAQQQAQVAYQQQRDAQVKYAQAAYNTPGSYPAPVGSVPVNGRMAAGGQVPAVGAGRPGQGIQTTTNMRQAPNMPANGNRPPPPPAGHPGQAPLPPNQSGQQPAAPPKPKPRRRPSKEYALAARQRQLQQEYTNYHHRPTKDNLWICEFCEYEDIFGVPPLAMIRRYEIRDRQERKKAEEKKRLLEKARAKGRKGKKGKGKNNNGANAGQQGGAHAANGQQQHPDDGAYGHGDHLGPPPPGEEEFYDDDEEEEYEDGEYGDEYEPTGPDDGHGYYSPPAPPTGTPSVHHQARAVASGPPPG